MLWLTALAGFTMCDETSHFVARVKYVGSY